MCDRGLAEAGLEEPPVVAAQKLCRLVGVKSRPQGCGKLRQVGVARQRTGADQAKLIGADSDIEKVRYGKVRVQALVTDRVTGNELYMPMNSMNSPTGIDEAVNRLTSSHTDTVTHTPAYKETSVQMIVLPQDGPTPAANPLPRTNSRFGHPTPQRGVEVERKWKRTDYRVPGDNSSAKLVQIKTT